MPTENLATEGAKATATPDWFLRNNALVLSILAAILCTSSQVKFAEVQLLEFLFAFDLLLLTVWLLLHPQPIVLSRPLFRIGLRWVIFMVLALLMALYALRQDFYVGGNVSLLKQPFMVTLSREGELFLDVFFMLLLAEHYRRDPWLLRVGGWTYFWVGVAGALYSVVSAIGIAAHIELGGAGRNYRMVGFNNEGGSYGTYLLTVIFLTLAMMQAGWLSKRAGLWSMSLFAIALLGSQSKAALFEIAIFALVGPAVRLRGIKLLVTTCAVAAVLIIAFSVINVSALVSGYTSSISSYEQISNLSPDDGNIVVGRVAGLFLAPKMIAAHPLAGIGWGNYPIVRDDPQYRRSSPIVETNLDSPSLGPIDYVVELGLPLFLYFTWVELVPALPLIRKRIGFGLISLVLMQPIANWFGAHLNLTYPWVAAAIALGMVYGPEGQLGGEKQTQTTLPAPVEVPA